jgi:hypothetical protein
MENLIKIQDFINLPIENIKIKIGNINAPILQPTTYEIILILEMEYEYTYKVSKRYTEFQGLYDSLTIRYHNINFEKFPSRTQIFNKEETRKKFFNSLLSNILFLSAKYKEIRKELLSIIYEFIFKNDNKKGEEANNFSMSLVISNDKKENLQNKNLISNLDSGNKSMSVSGNGTGSVSGLVLTSSTSASPFDTKELNSNLSKYTNILSYIY